MAIFRYCFRGCRAAVSYRAMVGLLYGAVALIAFIPAASVRSSMASILGSSVSADVLGAGFNFTIIGDILRNHGKELSASLGSVMPAFVLLIAVNLFFSGGIIAAVDAGEPSLQEYFRNCARYVGRMTRLFVLMLAIAVLVLLGAVVVLSAVGGMITRGADSEVPLFWMAGVDVVAAAFLLFVVLLIDDYAKIALVVENERSVWRSLKEAAVFLWSSRLAAGGISLMVFLLWAFLSAVYLALEAGFTPSAGGLVFLLVLLQQAYVAARVLLRVGWLSAETELYKDRRGIRSFGLQRAGMGVMIDID